MQIIYSGIKLIKYLSPFIRKLKIGDRVRLRDGYENPPPWLSGNDAYYGQVVGFINGPYKNKDAVVKLDGRICAFGLSGDVLVLTLRFATAVWESQEFVHIHLLEEIPDENDWKNIDKNGWDKSHIESHASYKIVKRKSA